MATATYKINSNTQVGLNWTARGVIALNPTGSPVYVRLGGTDFPTAQSADFIVPPATYLSLPITDTANFGLTFGTAVLPSQLGTLATIRFVDHDVVPSVANINLPQVINNALVATLGAFVAPGAPATVYTPPAGKGTAIYQLWGSVTLTAVVTIPLIIVTLRNVQTLAPIHVLRQLGTAGVGAEQSFIIPPLTFAPQPFILGINEQIRIENGFNGFQGGGFFMSYSNYP